NSPQVTSGVNWPQTNTTAAPETMPAAAPAIVSRRQNSDSSTIGPKAAPNPAQAKPTRLSTELSLSRASSSAITDTASTPMRPPHSAPLAESSTPMPPRKSSISAELDTISCEETVD